MLFRKPNFFLFDLYVLIQENLLRVFLHPLLGPFVGILSNPFDSGPDSWHPTLAIAAAAFSSIYNALSVVNFF